MWYNIQFLSLIAICISIYSIKRRQHITRSVTSFGEYVVIFFLTKEIMMKNRKRNIKILEKTIFLFARSLLDTIFSIGTRQLIVNRHESLEFYLGKEYPMFYDTLEDVKKLLTMETIRKAVKHLGNITIFYSFELDSMCRRLVAIDIRSTLSGR